MKTININDASEMDLDAITEMNKLLHDIHFKNAPDHFKPFNKIEIVNWLKTGIGNPKNKIIIAKDGDSYIGYTYAAIHERKENAFCVARKYIEIDHIFVAERHRKNGIATRLINEIKSFGLKNEIYEIELTTWCFNNAAIMAFEKFGLTNRYRRYNLKY